MKKYIHRLQKKWKQQSIQNQIFLSMLLVLILGIGILINFMYKASIAAIEQNYRLSYISSLKNSSKVLDMNLRSIIEGGRSFLNNNALQKILENSTEQEGNKFSTKEQEKLKDIANELASQQPWINYIIFADFHGHYYQLNNINIGTYEFYQYYNKREIVDEEWMKPVIEANGKEVFFGDDIPGAGNGNGFSYAKYMINPSSREPMGVMIIGLSKKMLGRSFVLSNAEYESSRFMVIDENRDNNLVYCVGNDKETAKVISELYNKEKNEVYLFSSVKNATTGWSVVNVVEKNELSKESKEVQLISFFVTGCVLLFSFFLAQIISKSITKPLKQLESTIALVGKGERHITEKFDDSEVGRIGRQFKEMVNTNLELSEHLMASKLNEREAELLLLQSQINPHFLYNTLDSLYLVAIMHGDDQMAEMVEALSDNFKLALNNGGKYIAVADSLKWIQGYMKLQNMRYNNRFELIVDISPEIMNKKTITFIFQPFIENAMYHGLEPKIGRGKINLKGWKEKDEMIFVIEDDGVGIEDMSRLEEGYGIRNVRERIRLNYGDAYGVSFESCPGKGTRVTIRVPVK